MYFVLITLKILKRTESESKIKIFDKKITTRLGLTVKFHNSSHIRFIPHIYIGFNEAEKRLVETVLHEPLL